MTASRRPVVHSAQLGIDISSWLVTAYVVMAIIMSTSAFYWLFADQSITESTSKARGSFVYNALWMAVYGATFCWLIVSVAYRGIHANILAALPLVFLILMSSIWSVNAGTTLYFGALLTTNMLISYVMAQLVEPERFFRITAGLMSVLLVVSLVGAVVAPDLMVSDRWGGDGLVGIQLHGVFGHKSDAAYYFAVLLLILVNAPGQLMSRRLRYGLSLLAIIGIVLANSATALAGILAISLLIWVLNRSARQRSRILIAAAVGLVAISTLVPWFDIGFTAVAVGRDAQLTGRADIWASAPEFIAKRPFLGYGYYGFFDTSPHSPVWELWGRSEWFKTPHFHNSAIDITISLGLVGLMLYLLALGTAFSVAWNPTIATQSRILMFALLLLLTMSAAFDYTYLRHNAFPTVFLFYCLFAARTRYREPDSERPEMRRKARMTASQIN